MQIEASFSEPLKGCTSWAGNCGKFGILIGILSCAASVVPQNAAADEDDVAIVQKYTPTGRHRIDLNYTQYDTFAGDVEVFLPTYTWAPRQFLRLSITGSVVSNDSVGAGPQGSIGGTTQTGVGDTAIGVQYDPTASLTASPWVPDSVGFFGEVIVPTGNTDKGLSTDTWFATIGAGWAIDSVSHLWINPAVGYEFTFNEDSLAAPVNQPYASLDLVWVFEFGAWIGISPRIGYDFEEDEWIDQYSITLGKMFRNGFGAGLSYGRIEQLSPRANRDDQTWLINLYYQFGKPPGPSVE